MKCNKCSVKNKKLFERSEFFLFSVTFAFLGEPVQPRLFGNFSAAGKVTRVSAPMSRGKVLWWVSLPVLLTVNSRGKLVCRVYRN